MERIVKYFILLLVLVSGCKITDVCQYKQIDGICPTPAPSESPTVTPTPTPTPTPTSSLDAIATSDVIWDESLAKDIASWPITAQLTQVSISDRIYGTRVPLDTWPSVQLEGWSKPSVGNWWIIAKCKDGKYHGGTMEWLGVNKVFIEQKKWDGTDDIHGCAGSEYRPTKGDVVYIMQSTHARGGVYNNNKQRTNTVKAVMP
jgi:hypothetical protein